MGLSIAATIAMPGIGGILVSCVLDGTFTDMLKAISTGDWALLAISVAGVALAGFGAYKALKAAGTVGKASSAIKSAPRMADGTAIFIKKGTSVYRAGGEIGSGFEHGSSYTLKSMKGMTRGEIIEKCGIPTEMTKNPVSHHLTYVANQDFWAEAGTSVGGTWPELRLAKGQGARVLDFVEQVGIPL